ncbi:MAG: type IV pilus assembly protein PilM [Verrucomicrobia bacterium]|nr:type IV pilus assembly protein PilM [Verrucomicrobiota bacterium]
MLRGKSFLCLDFGAGTLKMAEFEPGEGDSLRLKQFASKPLGLEGSQDETREATILAAIKELLAAKSFGASRANICAPGSQVFAKFVKLPPVDAAKVTQIIQYEAQQSVPFKLEEVVWDYQILGAAPGGELEVLLAAIKSEIVEGLFRTAEQSGLTLNLVDVSTAALCNSFRYNYGDMDGCTMLLDIGAKTSNLLFLEKGRIYSRSINIGANAITQDFAAEFKLPFNEAERLKIEEGFVSLGGAYEEPDNPAQAAISKISRQVMTRLHIQMNQTIQFYRGQQGGSAPQRLYLAGGASMMPYTAQFFGEKLNVPVEYFNPFRNVHVDEGVSLEELAKVAHAFGEVVGLGIRNLAHCPVDLNLMPGSYLQRRAFNQKKPYFIASALSLVAVVLAFGWFENKTADIYAEAVSQFTANKVKDLEDRLGELTVAQNKFKAEQEQLGKFMEAVDGRSAWSEILANIRETFIKAEDAQDAATLAQNVDTFSGVWIESFTPVVPEKKVQRPGALPVPRPPPDNDPDKPSVPDDAISEINLKCEAINLVSLAPDANTKFLFAVEQAFKTNAMFDPKGTALDPNIKDPEPTVFTFEFEMKLQLAKPIKLR